MSFEWTCHICGKERPNEKISVLSKPLRYRDQVVGEENIRYCNDNADCIEKAKDFSHLAALEPPESMYPTDTEKVSFRLHNTIWQAKHIKGTMIFFEANKVEEATAKVIALFNAMNLDTTTLGIFQIRRLPLCELK